MRNNSGRGTRPTAASAKTWPMVIGPTAPILRRLRPLAESIVGIHSGAGQHRRMACTRMEPRCAPMPQTITVRDRKGPLWAPRFLPDRAGAVRPPGDPHIVRYDYRIHVIVGNSSPSSPRRPAPRARSTPERAAGHRAQSHPRPRQVSCPSDHLHHPRPPDQRARPAGGQADCVIFAAPAVDLVLVDEDLDSWVEGSDELFARVEPRRRARANVRGLPRRNRGKPPG